MRKEKDPESAGAARKMHRFNRISVLDIIRNDEAVSRTEVARRSGLSAPTVSRIVEDLIIEGLVSEIGEGESSGGRRPTLLKFAGDGNYVIGIDLGTNSISGVLSDLDANILAESRCDTHVEEGFHKVMERTAGIIEELKSFIPISGKRILGVGMAVEGYINRRLDRVAFSPQFHWHNVDVKGELARWCDCPVVFDSVARVMSLGELCFGIGKSVKNFIFIKVGLGIGAGIILEGKPLYGPIGMAGSFGHITIDKYSEVQCDCGNFGCLQSLASGTAIAREARTRILGGERSLISSLCEGDPYRISAKMVAESAQQGDALAWEIFNKAMEDLGLGIAGLINLFSPEAIIIGGGVAQAGDLLFNTVRKVVLARALKNIADDVIIQPSRFGTQAAVMGAASMILCEILDQENIPEFGPSTQVS